MTAMFVNGSKWNEQFPQRTFHRCFLPRFRPFGQDVSEQKIFRNRTIRNKNCLWRPCLLMDRDKMSNLQRKPSIDVSYQVSVHLAKRFQRRILFQKSTNQKQELSVAAMFAKRSGRNQQSQQRTFHRCFLPSFGSFGQTFPEEKNLKNQPIKNKNRLWRPCLLTDRDGMGNLYRRPSIDSSYQVSDHLDKWFQRRFCICNTNSD